MQSRDKMSDKEGKLYMTIIESLENPNRPHIKLDFHSFWDDESRAQDASDAYNAEYSNVNEDEPSTCHVVTLTPDNIEELLKLEGWDE
jgi:hypothetical protein